MSSQAQQERLRQALHALVQEPGNQRCADCHTSAPRWANLHLGIFLCKDCAAAHRHLGPPLSQVRSIAYDVWTSAHVQHMRAVGNEKSNAHFVPAPQLFPAPVESEKASYEWIQYVRDKYVRLALRNQGLAHLSASRRTHTSPRPVATAPVPALPASTADPLPEHNPAASATATTPPAPAMERAPSASAAAQAPLLPPWSAQAPFAPLLRPPPPVSMPPFYTHASPTIWPAQPTRTEPASMMPRSRNPFL